MKKLFLRKDKSIGKIRGFKTLDQNELLKIRGGDDPPPPPDPPEPGDGR